MPKSRSSCLPPMLFGKASEWAEEKYIPISQTLWCLGDHVWASQLHSLSWLPEIPVSLAKVLWKLGCCTAPAAAVSTSQLSHIKRQQRPMGQFILWQYLPLPVQLTGPWDCSRDTIPVPTHRYEQQHYWKCLNPPGWPPAAASEDRRSCRSHMLCADNSDTRGHQTPIFR